MCGFCFILAIVNMKDMKKFTLLLLCVSAFAFGQKKKEYYLDENFKVISKADFTKRVDHSVNLDHYTENDTAVFGKLVTRETYGKLDNKTIDNLRGYLARLASKSIDTGKIILIHYYSGLDHEYTPRSDFDWERYLEKYKKKYKKTADPEEYWIYKDKENLKSVLFPNAPWLHDSDRLVENTFFPYHFNYGSFVIIHPNGNFYSYFGEHGLKQILERLEEFSSKYGK